MSSENFKYENDSEEHNDSGDQSPRETENVKALVRERQAKPQTSHNQDKNKVESQRKMVNSDVSTKGKLVQQHVKLKSQLRELASKMDQILEKERQRKKKKNQGNPIDEDQRIIELKRELKEQEIRIQKNKTEIGKLRRNLDNKYDINKIVQKQNQLKHLKKQLQSLQEEKESLQKIRKTQDKAIRSGEDKQTMNKISRMQEQLRQLTQKTKKQVETINEKEKQVRKLHETYIIKEQKVRQIETKMKEKKQGNQDINQYAISQLEDEIKDLETQRLEIQKEGNEKIRTLERERKELRHQLERKKLILEEKDKQLRLNQMKHKQIVRLINSSQNSQHDNDSSRVEKDSKTDHKRTVAKKGRQAPKIQLDDQDMIQENAPPKVEKKPKKQNAEYGTSANLEDPIDDYTG